VGTRPAKGATVVPLDDAACSLGCARASASGASMAPSSSSLSCTHPIVVVPCDGGCWWHKKSGGEEKNDLGFQEEQPFPVLIGRYLNQWPGMARPDWAQAGGQFLGPGPGCGLGTGVSCMRRCELGRRRRATGRGRSTCTRGQLLSERGNGRGPLREWATGPPPLFFLAGPNEGKKVFLLIFQKQF
jgi:hypothetical protein